MLNLTWINLSLLLRLTPIGRDLDEEFKLVAAAWNRAAPSEERSKIVFATLDFKNGREVFQAQRITNVPLVRLYPATEGPYTMNGDKEFELYDANRRGYGADALAEYVQQTFKTNPLIIRRPINYAYYATVAVSLLGVLALAKALSKQLGAIFKSNKLWSIVTIGWTTLMCSGYMWNSIRQPPYTGMRNGRPELVAGGFQNQFVLETQIVGVLYALTAVSFITLITKVPQVTDPTRQRTAAFVVLLVFIALYSVLLKFFKLKNGGYPFKLNIMSTHIHYTAVPDSITPRQTLVVGDRQLVQDLYAAKLQKLDGSVQKALELFVSEKLDSISQWSGKTEYKFVHLSGERSRNMGLVRSDLISDVVGGGKGDVSITLVLDTADAVPAAGLAVARAYPMYSRKSGKDNEDRNIYVEFITKNGSVSDEVLSKISITADSIRLCARLVDTPCGELNTATYTEEVKAVVSSLPTVKTTIISGTDLRDQGFGGLWNVGKAASNPPALVVLEHNPEKASNDSRYVFVGKGIVYDTGGLSIKISGNMVGMKEDMGGSAACFSAFVSAVKNGYSGYLACVLCLAENAVGPNAQRPDDILTLYSGKTIEVNNTDAEGRLVLADGVAYAAKNLRATHIIDMATLTGAQLITTGNKFASILSNSTSLESKVIQSGQKVGDWCFPILYAPETLKKEFDSKVADFRNSVKDRMNAQTSCAGHFVEICGGLKESGDDAWKGEWAHVDMGKCFAPSGGSQCISHVSFPYFYSRSGLFQRSRNWIRE
ncbi:putative aminopeptidase npepl1 [Gaertneriomyces sp. JEL0708]|nr:putative aminopeptidase npepl1 [Gaertneriomyces sp. JEL0708]